MDRIGRHKENQLTNLEEFLQLLGQHLSAYSLRGAHSSGQDAHINDTSLGVSHCLLQCLSMESTTWHKETRDNCHDKVVSIDKWSLRRGHKVVTWNYFAYLNTSSGLSIN